LKLFLPEPLNNLSPTEEISEEDNEKDNEIDGENSDLRAICYKNKHCYL
jgi:hypothetical protein